VWLPWLGKRLLSGLATILVISAVVYLGTLALPSDPARVILGPEATDAAVALLREQLGLNRPIPVQYFGKSLDSGVPAMEIVSDRLGNSFALMFLVLALNTPATFLLGVFMAVRRDSRLDRTLMALLIGVKAFPPFAIAVALIIVFSTSVLPIVPAVSLLDPALSALAQPQYLVLPVATLLLIVMPFLTRLIRAGMIEALDAEYIAAARLRGVPERRIVWRHAVPNALAPVIQGIAMTVRMLLGGALIVEVVYSYPGIGSALNSAIENRDIPVLQTITLLMAVSVVVINLLADFATVLLTPRLRTTAKPQLSSGAKARLRLKAGGV
jgi:peptide/nickel transport system permease protein